MAFNYEGNGKRFDRMAEFLGVIDSDGERVVNYLFEMNERLGLPLRLRDIGVTQVHLEPLSELALADFCHPNNPKPVSLEDFQSLYQKAF
jgi:alcohol dehydrogenase class IV